MTKFVIDTPSPEEASRLVDMLTDPSNAYDAAMAANNTVEVIINNDADAALELLAALVTAQPQYIAMGLENPLADALKQTAGLLRGRGAQIDAAVDGTVNGGFNSARAWFPRSDPLTLDGDGLETVSIDPSDPILFDHDGDGIANATGWIKPDDGFLVLNRNSNGVGLGEAANDAVFDARRVAC